MREGHRIYLAKYLRFFQTDAEKRLWYFLRAKRFCGIKFARQKSIGSYVVDFCCWKKKLIIEVDGSQHLEKGQADAVRTKNLEGRGYRVIRFLNTDVLKHADLVLENIFKTLEGAPYPLPS